MRLCPTGEGRAPSRRLGRADISQQVGTFRHAVLELLWECGQLGGLKGLESCATQPERRPRRLDGATLSAALCPDLLVQRVEREHLVSRRNLGLQLCSRSPAGRWVAKVEKDQLLEVLAEAN